MSLRKADELRQHDYFVGVRDPSVNPEFSGKFMVSDPLDNEGGYAIVGDDLGELVDEAHDHLLRSFREPQ